MTCPKCGARPEVLKTETALEGHARLLKCKDHGQFWSLERLWKWVVKLAGNSPATAGQLPGNSPPTAIAVGGEKEGGPSVSSLSGSDQESDSSLLGKPRRRARSGDRAETPAFKRFYDSDYPRKEKRPRAWRAWLSNDCEANQDAVFAGLKPWLSYWSVKADMEIVPHPASFLNGHQWNDKPPTLKLAPVRSAETFEQRRDRERDAARVAEEERGLFGAPVSR